ncbi:arsenate reductase/protein-tyrosine-phosphatase family protein [Hafnia psychrotolerans]|jgi:protein-tyrosine phosphatase|uniref:protein-tyrosine-phosphatase n=1 Tax=Hafnia psychrotolerans TaxID=1477018 RepID=A0ABQ1GNP7_9GAMM|nr:protein tyrosine phosphatase [Hafnia psychrotolerans]GGA47417.1 low molecular weight protein-tyrosine-phosphatase Etp [Hafnia psychrotolerans]
MFNSILVVCTGNICRSPIAERLLRNHLPVKKIDSAGVSALVGHAADDTACLISEQNGLSLEGHVGQQFSASLARKYDLILVMEKDHIEQISKIAPEARGKTMLLGYWLGQKEISDPYRKSYEAFESVYGTIDLACQSWIGKLNK